MHAVQPADLCFPPIAKYSLNCILSSLLLWDLNYFLIVHISSLSFSFSSGWQTTDYQRWVQDLCHLGVIINFLFPRYEAGICSSLLSDFPPGLLLRTLENLSISIITFPFKISHAEWLFLTPQDGSIPEFDLNVFQCSEWQCLSAYYTQVIWNMRYAQVKNPVPVLSISHGQIHTQLNNNLFKISSASWKYKWSKH